MQRWIATVCFCALGAVHVRGEMTVKQYQEGMTSEQTAYMAKLYVNALGEGMKWANMVAERSGLSLYCAPAKLALGVDNYLDILNRQIAKSRAIPAEAPTLDALPVALLLITGLKDTFPCPKGK